MDLTAPRPALTAAPDDLAAASTLDALPLQAPHRVSAVSPPAEAPHWARWLEELGFLPGEPVHLLARGLPGGEPLLVRVGLSTFALRRAEAACVQVRPA